VSHSELIAAVSMCCSIRFVYIIDGELVIMNDVVISVARMLRFVVEK